MHSLIVNDEINLFRLITQLLDNNCQIKPKRATSTFSQTFRELNPPGARKEPAALACSLSLNPKISRDPTSIKSRVGPACVIMAERDLLTRGWKYSFSMV